MRDCAAGAHIHARRAVGADGGIDDVVAVVLHGNRAFGALRFASAALNAFIFADYVSHCVFLSKLEKITGELLRSQNSTIRQQVSTLAGLPFVTSLGQECHYF